MLEQLAHLRDVYRDILQDLREEIEPERSADQTPTVQHLRNSLPSSRASTLTSQRSAVSNRPSPTPQWNITSFRPRTPEAPIRGTNFLRPGTPEAPIRGTNFLRPGTPEAPIGSTHFLRPGTPEAPIGSTNFLRPGTPGTPFSTQNLLHGGTPGTGNSRWSLGIQQGTGARTPNGWNTPVRCMSGWSTPPVPRQSQPINLQSFGFSQNRPTTQGLGWKSQSQSSIGFLNSPLQSGLNTSQGSGSRRQQGNTSAFNTIQNLLRNTVPPQIKWSHQLPIAPSYPCNSSGDYTPVQVSVAARSPLH